MKKKIIGRKDILDFPRLKLENIDVKIDTGAYSSSIHCRDIKVGTRNGKESISFVLLDPSHEKYHGKKFTSTTFKEKLVKSSNGISEKRYVITSDVLIFGEKHKIELSLTERGEMRFPILIGRKLLMGKFIVDTAMTDLSFKSKNKLNIEIKK
ncbi:MAG: RimK/LysX family protein [Flavobacteriales bacterium]